jgi:hypothetical protein
MRDVVALQPLEERRPNLRLLRDGGERNLLLFTL